MARLGKNRLLILLLAVVVLAAIFVSRRWAAKYWIDGTIELVDSSFKGEDYTETIELTEELLKRDPRQIKSAILGVTAAVTLKQPDRAISMIDLVLKEVGDDKLEGLDELLVLKAGITFGAQRAAEAEEAYRAALSQNPKNRIARERLGFLLIAMGRFAEAEPLQFGLLRDGHIREASLALLGTNQPLIRSTEMLEAFLKTEPKSPLPLLGIARVAMHDGDFSTAKEHLRRLVKARPDLGEAQALLGQVYLQDSEELRNAQLQAWAKQLPQSCENEAEIWLVRGLWSQQQADWVGAARCFGEALQRRPDHLMATSQLAGCLTAIGEPNSAKPLIQRAQLLEELRMRCHLLQQAPATAKTVARIAELCEQLGRYWEAISWSQLFLRRPAPKADQFKPERVAQVMADYRQAKLIVDGVHQRVSNELGPKLPRVAPEFQIASSLELSRFKLPDFTLDIVARRIGPTPELTRRPKFLDVTNQAGIEFKFQNADDPSTAGRRIIETTGGGVAVLDFDQDGWPDLYFTQGGSWPADSQNKSQSNDRLYHNLGNGTFADVTDQSGINNQRFSQGVTVGDYNNDGWPDLFVCNIGPNRLYLNHGDGTFTDATTQAEVTGTLWSTSAAMADLNGDGITDLYTVNYLQGDQAYHLICGQQKSERVCSPLEFNAAPDQLWLGQGDGSFRNVTLESGVRADRGNGLGCLVAGYESKPQLSVFVANDATANFMFSNLAPFGEAPKFQEQAVLSGLAFSQAGLSQGCMGIAADDVDADGRLDLFVTNFYNESNALYRQQETGNFLDESGAWGIPQISQNMLGFGTQFLDAELDGLPDLIVVNGHVDDLTSQGIPFKMPAQYLRNIGGRFIEWPANELGPYFSRKILGRGLARVDWNLDGKEDFVVSHLESPAALIENQSENAGHYLAVELTGTQSARDAIGTQVTLEIGTRKYVKQLTAGDGYQASNHRRLVFGLGDHQRIDRISVRWPNGTTESFEEIAADGVVRLIEAKGMFRLPQLSFSEAAQ